MKEVQKKIYVVPAGVALLCAAVFFGYMLALLQRRIGALFSSNSVSNYDLENPFLCSFPNHRIYQVIIIP